MITKSVIESEQLDSIKKTILSEADERIYYLDHVRAFAMLLGVFFHAALAYGYSIQNVWLIRDNSSSIVLEVFAWFSHLFRMGLFFLLSGFFANFLIKKRGVRSFLKNRLIRIVLPFIVFYPLIIISFVALFSFAIGYLTDLPPILQFIKSVQGTDYEPPMRTSYLWFLYNLMFFCGLAALFQRIRSERVTKLAASFFGSAKHLLYFPLLLVPALYSTTVPVPAPEKFTPELWSFGYYGIFFLLGWHFFKYQNFLDIIGLHWKKLLVFSLVGYGVFFYLIPEFALLPAASEAFSITKFVTVVLEAYLSVYLVFLMLFFGKQYFSKKRHFLRYISDASYWIYLVHLPIIFYIQVLLAEVDLNVWIKFFISTFGTLAVAILVYDLVIRYSPIGTMLNGKKRRSSFILK